MWPKHWITSFVSNNTEKKLGFYPRKMLEVGLSWNIGP